MGYVSITTTDYVTVFLGAIALCFLRCLLSGIQSKRFRFEFSVFSFIGRYCCKPGKILKFRENLFYALWHTTSFSIVISLLFSSSWFQDVLDGEYHTFFLDDDYADSATRNVYFLQLSFWLSCLIYCGFETWREDTAILIAHHFFTLFLLFASWQHTYWKIGLIVLNIHDLSDILLYTAKTLSYSKVPETPVTAVFGSFAVSFLLTRNVLYPMVCIFPAIDALTVPRDPPPSYLYKKDRDFLLAPVACTVFMCLLEVLHIYWLYLIVRMIYRQIVAPPSRKRLRDDRSTLGSEGEMSSDASSALESDAEEVNKKIKRGKKSSAASDASLSTQDTKTAKSANDQKNSNQGGFSTSSAQAPAVKREENSSEDSIDDDEEDEEDDTHTALITCRRRLNLPISSSNSPPSLGLSFGAQASATEKKSQQQSTLKHRGNRLEQDLRSSADASFELMANKDAKEGEALRRAVQAEGEDAIPFLGEADRED
eukprot:GDKJ01011052.1.p1 GENE.GDKJ01011052.1~~GDKJ01011052.1.p1  ORF type:complete len:483 (-),score=124.27 GDKJ01011052.1:635-2083(-)